MCLLTYLKLVQQKSGSNESEAKCLNYDYEGRWAHTHTHTHTHTHILKWWADSSCHWTIEASAASAGGHRHTLIVDDLIQREEEDLLPTGPHRISHILLIHLTPGQFVFACLLVCLFVVRGVKTSKHQWCLWAGTLLSVTTSPGFIHLFIYLTYWAHTLFRPLASVNKAEMGLHSDLSSSPSSTLLFFCVCVCVCLFWVLLWTRPFSQVYKATLMSLTGPSSWGQ